MHYQAIRNQFLAFAKKHPSYFWSVLELSMILAAAYAIFGLITMVTGAMASGSSIIMILEFMAAPLYSVLLFAVTSTALCLMLILPYALATGSLVPAKSAKAHKRSAKPRNSSNATRRRKTKTA